MLSTDLSIVIPVHDPGEAELNAARQLVESFNLTEAFYPIIAVNDSRSDLRADYIGVLSSTPEFKVICSGANYGRAHARNCGAKAAKTKFIWFLDSDCIVSLDAIELVQRLDHRNMTNQIGIVRNNTLDGFWSKYQNAERKGKEAYTAANLILKRTCFETVGMFDESYVQYGFEDVDLFERLKKIIHLNTNPALCVEHNGFVSLGVVARKIRSASYSGRIFSRKHPESYRKTPYFKVDHKFSKTSVRLLLLLCSPLHDRSFGVLRWIVDRSSAPYALKRLIVKFSMAVSYFSGTRHSDLGVNDIPPKSPIV